MSIKSTSQNRSLIAAAGIALLLTGIGVTYFLKTKRNNGNELTTQLTANLEKHQSRLPADLVYVHLDRPLYQPGEKIWFQGYLRNAADLKPATWSEILHVELLGPNGQVLQKREIVSAEGLASGDFDLPETAAGGIYKVKAYSQWQKNEKEPAFFTKEIQVQRVSPPNLKMKFEWVRRAYGPGDEVLAKVVAHSLDNQPLAGQSFNFDVKLGGKTQASYPAAFDKKGEAYLTFKLPVDLNSVDGLVNVRIPYRNKTEAVSRNIPIMLNGLQVKFFPEGGNFVAGLENRVAFEAVNEFGKPADVAGVVYNEKGEEVAAFNSLHHGRGDFSFAPQKEKYTVKITKPAGVAKTYELPAVAANGVAMKAETKDNEAIRLKIASTKSQKVSIVAQVRGKIYHTEEVSVDEDGQEIEIPTANMPMGVAQITVFNSKGEGEAERLAFVNYNSRVKCEVKPSKEKYLPREKVEMTIKTTDDKGKPVKTSLSMAVVDDKLLAFADDKDGNIFSKLLLEPEVSGKVEEAKFYFDPNEKDAQAALDDLLMTRGWRRFTWKEIANPNPPLARVAAEQAVVAGVVRKGNSQKPIADAVVSVEGTNLSTKTLPNGQFRLRDVNFENKALRLTITHPGSTPVVVPVTEYTDALKVELFAQGENAQSRHTGGFGFVGIFGGTIQAASDGNTTTTVTQASPGASDAKAASSPAPAPQPEAATLTLSDPNLKPEVSDLRATVDKNAIEKTPVAPVALAEKAEDMSNKTESKLDNIAPATVAVTKTYYKAKEFAAPVYQSAALNVNERSDFRPTAFWNGNVRTDENGNAKVTFYNTDAVTAFRATVEGIADNGQVAHQEATYTSQAPLEMALSVPASATLGDVVRIPVTLTNHTSSPMEAVVNVRVPAGLVPKQPAQQRVPVPANGTKTYYMEYAARYQPEVGEVTATYAAGAYNGKQQGTIEIVEPGYPQEITLSGNVVEKDYPVEITNPIDSSLNIQMEVYPSPLAEMIEGLESMIREPNGCFEQTTSSNYPNIAILQYLKEYDYKNPALAANANKYLAQGYEKLLTFETQGGGFEMFGHSPGHEALTAYALMQFNDMRTVYDGVDPAMLKRNQQWLYSRRDSKGGFKNGSKEAMYGYGSADKDITDTYIVYALTQSGYKDLEPELKAAKENAVAKQDPYCMALVAGSLNKLGRQAEAEEVIKKLVAKQQNDGSWAGTRHSFIHTEGEGLKNETTSLAVMAILSGKNPNQDALHKAANYLASQRKGFGGYGNTQSTVLSLKAITALAKNSRHAAETGTVEVYVDNQKVAAKTYDANQREKMSVAVAKQHFKPGKHNVKVKFAGTKHAMPYTMRVGWRTLNPANNSLCKIDLKAQLATAKTKVGETVRLTVSLQNKTNGELAMPMAVIGIPGGLALQPFQLKEMAEKGAFDYYEIKGDKLVLYFYKLKGSEKKDLTLDLRAETPGQYSSPASNAYQYYFAENRVWTKSQSIAIAN